MDTNDSILDCVISSMHQKWKYVNSFVYNKISSSWSNLLSTDDAKLLLERQTYISHNFQSGKQFYVCQYLSPKDCEQEQWFLTKQANF